MSKFKKNGNSQKITLSDYLQDEKRFEWRIEWQERMEHRCIIYNSKGLATRCRKDCTKCPSYWNKKPQKVSIDRMKDDYDYEFPSNIETPEEYAERMEKEERVRDAINSLPSEDLKAVVYMIMYGYSYSEIAKKLGISKATVSKRWEKAKPILREKLKDYESQYR